MPRTHASRTHASLPRAPSRLAASLGRWFAANRRELPWREERSAYRVWLSEVMLQQTRVSVVQEYYARFLARFPDVQALAAASEDDVLALWSGLGYYSRGRNLHRAARAVAFERGGAFPRTKAALRELPGVGDYTAAAIASLAFGEREAVVDGNVARVLMRVCGDVTPIDSPAGKRVLAERAQALIARAQDPGAHNEALMELGALVCTPKSPACGACPWKEACVARGNGTTHVLPVKARKARVRALDIACVVVTHGDSVWLERRASAGLFGGLHEPPAHVLREGDVRASIAKSAVERAWRELCEARGLSPKRRWPRPVIVDRQLTHRDLRFHCVRLESAEGGSRFVERARLGAVGVSAAVRAVLEAVWQPFS